MTTRAVIFDIGGVLEFTAPTGWAVAWEARLALPAGEINRRCADLWAAGALGEITEAEVRTQVAARLGLDRAGLDALMADLWRDYLGTPNEDLIAYLRTLRGRCRRAILSNSFVGAREREQPILDLVDVVVYSHEVGIAKPDPEAFALTAKLLQSRPEDCLFIDDHPPNIAAAQAFGMRAILFTGNDRTIAAVEDHLRV